MSASIDTIVTYDYEPYESISSKVPFFDARLGR
jgi:hypothetical protein